MNTEMLKEILSRDGVIIYAHPNTPELCCGWGFSRRKDGKNIFSKYLILEFCGIRYSLELSIVSNMPYLWEVKECLLTGEISVMGSKVVVKPEKLYTYYDFEKYLIELSCDYVLEKKSPETQT